MTDTSLPAPLPTETKRAYAVRLGLANPTRGRFGKDALLAIATAEAQGHTFVEPVVATPKPKATTAATPAAPKPTRVALPKENLPATDPKAVRAWAKQNGHTVGDRGRIHADVIKAYLADGGKAVAVTTAEVKRPTPLDMPKVRRENSGWSRVKGILIRQDRCGKCTAAVSRCTCKTGPQAHAFLSKEVGEPVILTLDKPSL